MDEEKIARVNAVMQKAELDIRMLDVSTQDMGLVMLHHGIAALVKSVKPEAILRTAEQLVAAYDEHHRNSTGQE